MERETCRGNCLHVASLVMWLTHRPIQAHEPRPPPTPGWEMSNTIIVSLQASYGSGHAPPKLSISNNIAYIIHVYILWRPWRVKRSKYFANFLALMKNNPGHEDQGFCLGSSWENRAWNPGSDLCPHLLAFKVTPHKKGNSWEMRPICREMQYPNFAQVV